MYRNLLIVSHEEHPFFFSPASYEEKDSGLNLVLLLAEINSYFYRVFLWEDKAYQSEFQV